MILRWMDRVGYTGNALGTVSHLVRDDTLMSICGQGPSWRGRWRWHPDNFHCLKCEQVYPKLPDVTILDNDPAREAQPA